MSIVKLKSVIKGNKPYPINGVTTKAYKNNNHQNLNDSFSKNEFEYNIWLSEKQCGSLGITLIDKLNPSYTISRWGVKNEIFNISQTDFFKPKNKKTTPSQRTINQTQLSKRLKLPINVVSYLKGTNTIKWKKVGREVIFEETSILKFEKNFDRNNYLKHSKCNLVLDRWNLNDTYVNKFIKTVRRVGDYSVTMKSLRNDPDGVFGDYKLKYKQFDKTIFIEKLSFFKTLRWLRKEYLKRNPKINPQHLKKRDTKKSPFEKKRLKFRRK